MGGNISLRGLLRRGSTSEVLNRGFDTELVEANKLCRKNV